MLKNRKGMTFPFMALLLFLLTVLGAAALFTATEQSRACRRAILRQDALLFAEAGFYRYMYFLNVDDRFHQTPASAALEAAPIPFQDGFYDLTVTPPGPGRPVVTVASRGWTAANPNIDVTVTAEIFKKQFVQFAYISNVEQTGDGRDVWWVCVDDINGPVHTNNTLNITGSPVFRDAVTFSIALNERAPVNADYRAGRPQRQAVMAFPATNADLRGWAQSPDGYYFQGRTAIMLNANGDITVKNNEFHPSPNRAGTQVMPLPANGVIYVDGVGTGKWDPDVGNVFISGTLNGLLTVAAQNDIYITAWDPTNWSQPNLNNPGNARDLSGATPQGALTGGINYSDPANDMLGLIANRYIRILHLGWPRCIAPGQERWSHTFTESVAVLVGHNIFGWPVWEMQDVTFERMAVSPWDINIDAAVFALNGSFEYEEFGLGVWWGQHPSHPAWMPDRNRRGKITLRGSLIQQNRGGVGLFNRNTLEVLTGYDKDYSFDARMAWETPPHFLSPVGAGWEIVGWQEE